VINIVILGGTGDVYLLSALFEVFRQTHNRDAVLVVRERYRCIPEMFGVPCVVDDGVINNAEVDIAMQRDYDNTFIDGRNFYAHPSFLRTQVRVDHLTTKPDVSQADMYKAILRVPWGATLALPKIPEVEQKPGKVVLIPDARSWPNLYPGFWGTLATKLSYAGWNVQNNNGSGWSLKQLFAHCAEAEWVIGPQCGVMSILVTGRFPCRKTLASCNIDGSGTFIFSTHTFPYAYVTKFSNHDYDVEEFKICADGQVELADTIVSGQNGLRLWPHDPGPACTINVSLSPGDFLDRLAVLTVKHARFTGAKRAAIERDYQRHRELRARANFGPHIDKLFDRLVRLHAETFDLLETMVPGAMADDTITPEAHVAAVKLNKVRVSLKREIDGVCRSPFTEQKSYYGE